jgi:hypothetical protein
MHGIGAAEINDDDDLGITAARSSEKTPGHVSFNLTSNSIDGSDHETKTTDPLSTLPATVLDPDFGQVLPSVSQEASSLFQQGLDNLNTSMDASRRGRRGSSSSESSISIASIADSIFTTVTTSSRSSIYETNMQIEAPKQLAQFLLRDDVLKPLFQEALGKIGCERLERNLSRLLKRFAMDLRKESSNPLMTRVALFICKTRGRVSHITCECLEEERLVEDLAEVISTISEDAVLCSSDENSDAFDSDDEETDTIDFDNVKVFILGSTAIERLRQNVRKFVSPISSSSTPAEETMTSDTETAEEELYTTTPEPELFDPTSTAISSSPLLPVPVDGIGCNEVNNMDTPSELHFPDEAAASREPEQLSCHGANEQSNELVLTINRTSLSSVVGCVCFACGFLLPAFVGALLGYYLRSTASEEGNRDLAEPPM